MAPNGATPSLLLTTYYSNATMDQLSDMFLNEQFRQSYRESLALGANVSYSNVIITSIQSGSINVNTVITFPLQTNPIIIQALYDRVQTNPTDISWLFSSNPQLQIMYGTPAATAINKGMEIGVLSSVCSATTRPTRPSLAMYAPARTGQADFPLVFQLAGAWPFLASSACGSQLQCLVAVRNGAVKQGSLTQLDTAGLLFELRITVSTPGSIVDVMVPSDVCNPSSSPQFLSVASDVVLPTASLSITQEPTLGNSSFVVVANFSETVLPITPANVSVSGARVREVRFVGAAQGSRGSSAVITLDGQPGVDASVQLSNGNFMDTAMNLGSSSNQIAVSVPAPGLAAASTGFRWASLAALGLSGAACAASTVLAPGWATLACGAGLLRSLGHLQLASMSGRMAADMPPAFTLSTDSSSWARMTFLPTGMTDWSQQLSVALKQNESATPPPPPSPPTAYTVRSAGLVVVYLCCYNPSTKHAFETALRWLCCPRRTRAPTPW